MKSLIAYMGTHGIYPQQSEDGQVVFHGDNTSDGFYNQPLIAEITHEIREHAALVGLINKNEDINFILADLRSIASHFLNHGEITKLNRLHDQLEAITDLYPLEGWCNNDDGESECACHCQ